MGCNKYKYGHECKCKEKNVEPAYDEPIECNEEPCSEMFSTECILNIQDTMFVDGQNKKIQIDKRERLYSIIQKLMVLVADNVSDIEGMPENFKCISKTNSEITLSFDEKNDKIYNIYYKKESSTSEYVKLNVSKKTTLINLSSDTTYHIYVKNVTDNINSVTLSIKTLK